MNPLLGAARRTRTFLSQPVREADDRAGERDEAAAAKSAEILEAIQALGVDVERGTRETRRLFVSLRQLLEEQQEQIAELRHEVDRLRAAAS
jgi:hypothetical protein